MQTSSSMTPRPAGASIRTARPARRVVDAATRMFHWLFALSFLGAYLSAEGERWRALHVTLGYTLAGLLVFRVLYGIFGPRQVGLAVLWRKLVSGPAWIRSLLTRPSAINWRQGQNLGMALAIFTLLALALPLTLSGYATYAEWGDVLGGEWLADLHAFFGEAFLAVVLAHLALIVGLSILRRQNQAQPMLNGRIDGAGPDLVKNNRGWLAAALLVAVLSFWGWQWQQSPNGLFPTNAWSGDFAGQRSHHDDD